MLTLFGAWKFLNKFLNKNRSSGIAVSYKNCSWRLNGLECVKYDCANIDEHEFD